MSKYKPFMRVANGLWALDKGAGMIEINLLDSLVAELSELFKDYALPAKSGLLQNVKVFAQYLPQPSAIEVFDDEDETEEIAPQGYSPVDIEANFPCIIVKLDDAVIKEEGTIDSLRINVNFLIGTYDDNPDCQGYRDVLNIIERIQQYILGMEGRILQARYQLKMPMKSYLFEEQSWPFYFGQIETIWETARPLMAYYPIAK
ncbi:MAG: hypothetical protein IJ597_07560 [Synergistaceae bacterium]|nr:hypothetical protein [Synergistaceae bacterium]